MSSGSLMRRCMLLNHRRGLHSPTVIQRKNHHHPLLTTLWNSPGQRNNSSSSSTTTNKSSGAVEPQDTVERLPILPNPPVPPAPVHERLRQPRSLWQRIVTDTLSLSGQQSKIQRGESLFQAAKQHSFDPRWFGPGRIPRDFRSRHAILTFHVWLLHKRLLADTYAKETALAVDEELFNILWDDTTCRIRQAGVYELAVNKHLLQVQQYTFVHLTHYDHCYTGRFLEEPMERLRELRQLVWLHWFQSDDAVQHRTDHLDRLCWYIDANYRNIVLELPDDYYRESRIRWVDLPDFSNLLDVDGTTRLVPMELHPDDVVPSPWLRNITSRGTEYYWNPETSVSQYERPLHTARVTN